MDTLTSEQLSNQVQELLIQRKSVSQEIACKLPELEKAVYQNVELLESLLTETMAN